MPWYDYRCPRCGDETRRQHSIAACDETRYCSAARCDVELERLIASPAIAADKTFRMQATTESGRKIDGHFDGHFGISAPNRGFGKRD